ncbi:hypothetical protein IX87_01085 [Acinetobacter baumannii]|uniref:hypothetical protein n=1 Tax=Acinetobacter baumannii TaxID=470 RepID=UPI0004F82D3D|nr:hypothetical protein [Acinetobacter baumannii]AIL77274.1 hypothetical protein IX87_01085 [Acinetobacter baumannii]
MSEYEEKKLFIEKIAQACDLLYDLSMEGSRITGRAKNNDDLIKVTNLLRDAEKIEEELSFSSNGLIITFYKVLNIFKNFDKLLNDSNYRRDVPAQFFYLIESKKAFYFDRVDSYFENYLNIIDLLRKSLLQVHPIYQCSD